MNARHQDVSIAPSVGRAIDLSPVARLAITRPGRTPWAVPIVYAYADQRIWSPVDGKPKAQMPPMDSAPNTALRPIARIGHLRREGSATLLIDRYDEDWTQLWWIRLTLKVAVLELPPDTAQDHIGALALLSKYRQYASTALFGTPPTLLEMHITAVASWSVSGDFAS
ncbi:MAG: hypothetical protein ACI8PT_001318 [Gammaproteobacteria bacterium]|jgi:hypothetical protein